MRRSWRAILAACAARSRMRVGGGGMGAAMSGAATIKKEADAECVGLHCLDESQPITQIQNPRTHREMASNH
jgi:hypothetical protein